MSFTGLKGGQKGTDGDIEIPQKAGSIVFLFWKKEYQQMTDIKTQKTVTNFFKIKARWTSELGGNITDVLLFKVKQESRVLLFQEQYTIHQQVMRDYVTGQAKM